MKKRIAVIMLSVAVLIICMAAAMTGCKDKGNECADLVALRINNHMAEWVDSNYNFDYKGVGELNVTVPYTNYLEINDLIVSPEATATIYDDEACSSEIKEKDYYMYIDGNRTLYIKVTNGRKSHTYKINIAVKQSNLPENVDLSAKNYENRGGHIYIPDGEIQVDIDGKNYYVIDRLYYSDIVQIVDFNSRNFILSDDSSSSLLQNFGDSAFNGIFDGNGYKLLPRNHDRYILDPVKIKIIGEKGVIKNVVLATKDTYSNNDGEYLSGIEGSNNKISLLCDENYGIIDNVCNIVNIYDRNTKYGGANEGEYVHRVAIFADVNRGVISNCLNKGNIYSKISDSKIRQFSVFANEMRGEQFDFNGSAKLVNCVNTGNLEYNDEVSSGQHRSGAFVIASLADAYVQVDGVYNLGNIQSSNIKRKYSRYFASATTACEDGKSRDVDCSKIKDYTK